MNTIAIATHLNIVESAITRIEEWASVIFVVIKGVGARFVSKKAIPQAKVECIGKTHFTVKVNGKETMFWRADVAKAAKEFNISESVILAAFAEYSAPIAQAKPPIKPIKKVAQSLEYEMYNPNGMFYG